MPEENERRKLVAIVYADVKSYSRLMGEDESFTVRTLTKYRHLFSQNSQKYGGRVVNAPGDSILAEFPSVVDALNCAVEIQDQLKTANASLPVNRKMKFRIGINLGDVIQKGNDIFGDGVNIAARVETLAEEGGISITRPVFDQVKKKLTNLGYEYIGKHFVKNISDPIRVYRVLTDSTDAGRVIGKEAPRPSKDLISQTVCIAVLPFDNLSDNRSHDYFSRGIVEDLITDLSRFHSLQVISSSTTRKMATAEQNEIEVARTLAIDYLLKGSLRRKGNQIRITAQLLGSSNGGILWAERYDASLDKIFDIQDDIIARVVGALSAQIDKTLLSAARKKPLTNLAAYDCWLRGMDYLRQGTLESDQEARRTFEQALAMDPQYSRAYAGLSLSYFNEWSCQLWDHWEATERNAYRYAMEAIRLDDTDHIIQAVLGRILLYRRQFDLAEQHLDRSLSLNANDADNLVQIASCKAFLGKAGEGEQLFKKALRLNPYRNTWYYTYGALTHFVQRQYGVCIEIALKGPLTDVWLDQPGYIAAAYAYMGDKLQASQYLDIFIDTFQKEITSGRKPQVREILSWIKMANPFKNEDDIEHLIEGIDRAGLQDSCDKRDSSSPVDPHKIIPLPTNVLQKENELEISSRHRKGLTTRK